MKEENFRKWNDGRSTNWIGNKYKIWVIGSGLGLLAFTLLVAKGHSQIYFNGLLPLPFAMNERNMGAWAG